MQESSPSLSRSSYWPARIAFACFMFAVVALIIWDQFYRFDWVAFLCGGLYCLVLVPIKKGEAPGTYFAKPRTIVSFALLAAVMVSAAHSLHRLLQ